MEDYNPRLGENESYEFWAIPSTMFCSGGTYGSVRLWGQWAEILYKPTYETLFVTLFAFFVLKT